MRIELDEKVQNTLTFAHKTTITNDMKQN